MNISVALRNSTTMAMALASPASASSSSSSGSPSSSVNGQQETKRYVQEYLTNCKSFYSCIYCRTHLANHDELVSRSFQGNHGRAYLFNSVINISCGPAMQRELNTGAHAVADIYCSNCETTLGWKYEKAYVKTQKYKEGKYIIELAHVVRENRQLELDKRDLFLQSQNIHNRNHYYNQQERSISHSISSTSANKQNNPSSPSSSVDSAIATSPSSSLFSSSPRSTSSSSSASSSSSPSSPPTSFSSPAARPQPLESNLNASTQSDNNIFNSNNASIRDIIDDDLMFPYYDDLCIEDDGRVSGSFVGSFSSACLHNRIRRSLYLDSKPYDWKYSTRSISERAADRTKQPDEEEKQEQTEQQRDNNNSPKLSWQHQEQTTDTPSEGSSQLQQQPINFSNQSMTDKIQCDEDEDEDEDDLDSGNSSSGDEQVKLSNNNINNNNNDNVTAQREQQLLLKRNQVDESEIQFNFEADNIFAEQHINYSQQEQQNHQIATAMSNNSHVEHQQQQFAQQNNNKPICDQQQPQQTSTGGDKFECSVQAGNCALTSNGNSSTTDNNNSHNDNDNIKQPVGLNSNLVATTSDQKSELENELPKLDDQTSTITTTTEMSSSFSFDDEEFYDCYTS